MVPYQQKERVNTKGKIKNNISLNQEQLIKDQQNMIDVYAQENCLLNHSTSEDDLFDSVGDTDSESSYYSQEEIIEEQSSFSSSSSSFKQSKTLKLRQPTLKQDSFKYTNNLKQKSILVNRQKSVTSNPVSILIAKKQQQQEYKNSDQDDQISESDYQNQSIIKENYSKEDDENLLKEERNQFKEDTNQIKQVDDQSKDQESELKKDEDQFKEDDKELKNDENDLNKDENDLNNDENELLNNDENELNNDENELNNDENECKERSSSIADMTFDDINKEDQEQQEINNPIVPYFNKQMKKGSTIRFKLDIAAIGNNSFSLNDTETNIARLDSIRQKSKPSLFNKQRLNKDQSSMQVDSQNDFRRYENKDSIKSCLNQSVKFKLSSPKNGQGMNKGKSFSQVEHLLMHKQSLLRNKESKKVQNTKSLFSQNSLSSNKLNKNENILQTKKQNKYLQKFINLVKSNSLNRQKSEAKLEQKNILDNTFATVKDSGMPSFFSVKKADQSQISQKIKNNFQKLVEGFQSIQEQLSNYNNLIQTNSESQVVTVRYNHQDFYQFQEEFEKMKHFEIYFPQNNVDVVVDSFNKVQMAYKKRLFRHKKKSHSPKQERRVSTRYSQKLNIRKITSQVQ